MLREAERVIDHQVRALEELDDKSEQMITVTIAALAGGVAMGLLLAQESLGLSSPAATLSLGLAGALNLLALGMFLFAYLGGTAHTEVEVGPSIRWLVEKSNDETWDEPTHLVSAISGFTEYDRHNIERMAHATDWRRRGLLVLFGSLFTYGATLLYIARGSI